MYEFFPSSSISHLTSRTNGNFNMK